MSGNEWKPIETAPFEEPVLISTATGICVAERSDYHQRWYVCSDEGMADDKEGGGVCWVWNDPTHWMPLPDPPLPMPA